MAVLFRIVLITRVVRDLSDRSFVRISMHGWLLYEHAFRAWLAWSRVCVHQFKKSGSLLYYGGTVVTNYIMEGTVS